MSTRASDVALGLVAGVLAVAVASLGQGEAPYAPNNWVFSHVFLADLLAASGEVPQNSNLLADHSFGGTRSEFQRETGLATLTPYATTLWHFWNGIPLHPTLLGALAVLSDQPAESVARVPVALFLVPPLAFATARLALDRTPGVDRRVAVAAPFAAALASFPLVLELRVLLPSSTLVAVQLLLHMMLRRGLLGDRVALPLALAPLLLLPFWYYTMAYFALLVFLGFVAYNAARRARGASADAARVPTPAALAVFAFLALALVANGALTSHLELAASMTGNPLPGPDAGSETGLDYGSYLNRAPWRSALLYASLLALFVPLGLVASQAALRAWRREPHDVVDGVVVQWAVGGVLFSAVLLSFINVSFLNRTVIYLTPVATLAGTVLLARRARERRAWRAATLAFAVWALATPALMLTASPRFDASDAAAFEWAEARVPADARVYGPMEAGSVLFRAHGLRNATAFHPSLHGLETFWYGTDVDALAPFVASVDYLVLRDDVRERGFEDFSPARRPLPVEAYEKFSRSRDLQRVFDSGDVLVFKSALDPSRVARSPDG